ncbi:MAG: DNA alkylation repair protein [Parabacteroides sp.]|nr:DNA alkylation repair protein [Parabacteroides sp.]
MLQDELKEIRTQLRLAMNGVIATSMREKGIVYKLNFGVPLPEIKQIAAAHEPNSELAAALWKEDIREFKILASLLQPVGEFSSRKAGQWVKEIPYLEIAEQCSHNLFYKLPDVEDLLLGLIFNVEDEYARTVAYLVWAELFKEGRTLIAPVKAAFIVECMRTIARPDFGASFKEKQAAVKAMKFYGRQSAGQARQMLDGFDEFPEFRQTSEGEEIYNDLKFEFEYCR